jgi:hypothetical protein
MENTLPGLIAYFRQVATEHLSLKGSFVHGAAARIISGSRSGLVYPLLWLETPTLQLREKDGTMPFGQRTAAFVILQSVSSSDYVAQDGAWNDTEAIALDVLSRLRKDRAARLFTMSFDGGQLEAVALPISANNEIGWRYEFTLGEYVDLKYHPARWLPTT